MTLFMAITGWRASADFAIKLGEGRHRNKETLSFWAPNQFWTRSVQTVSRPFSSDIDMLIKFIYIFTIAQPFFTHQHWRCVFVIPHGEGCGTATKINGTSPDFPSSHPVETGNISVVGATTGGGLGLGFGSASAPLRRSLFLCVEANVCVVRIDAIESNLHPSSW